MNTFRVFLLLYCGLIGLQLQAQTNRALIIAIGNYPFEGGWRKINSLNDVPYIQQVLQRHQFSDIRLLKDKEATAKGIGEAFKKLVDDARRGDKIVIHVSAHGAQVADDNNDEADGYDECIVGYNAVTQRKSMNFSKDQAEYFRDDEFGSYINQLRKKLGKDGDIVVFIDACHSGTGTRGDAAVRGGEPPLEPKGYSTVKKNNEKDEQLYSETNLSRGDEATMAGFVIISAARADELDYETKDDNNQPVGPLTYAVSKVFNKVGPGTSYRSLFAAIQIAMDQKISNSLQHPVLEGTGIDRELLGGNYLSYSAGLEIEQITGREIKVKAGRLFGLEEGAKVGLYRSEAMGVADSSLISGGVVTRSNLYDAVVMLENDPVITKPVEGKIFVTGPVYKIDPVTIGFHAAEAKSNGPGLFSKEQMTSIQGALKQLPVVSVQQDPDLLLIKGNGIDSVKLAANGYVFQTMKDMSSNTAALTDIIRDYAQYRFLKSLNVNGTDAGFGIDIKLVPFVDGRADTSMIQSKMHNGVCGYYAGDTLVLWVTNKSSKPIYINILDLQPDGVINKILPNRDQGIYPSDLRFEAGASRLMDKYLIRIFPPFGNEIFKVFVSDREMDMEGIATSRGALSKGDFGFLETLLRDSYSIAGKRGGEGISLAGTNGATYDVLFEIKAK